MVFNVHYKADTGDIMSYQEGPDQTPADEIPQGCLLLAFQSYVPIVDGSGILIKKVDLQGKQLVDKNPPPQPIN